MSSATVQKMLAAANSDALLCVTRAGCSAAKL